MAEVTHPILAGFLQFTDCLNLGDIRHSIKSAGVLCGEMQIVLRLFESRAKVSYWVAIS